MLVAQAHLKDTSRELPVCAPRPNRLVLVFGSVSRLQDPALTKALKRAYGGAVLAGCSTAGEITREGVSDDSVTVTSIAFEHTRLRSARARGVRMTESRAVGERLAAELAEPDLGYVLVLSDGVHVNGSDLVAGLVGRLPSDVLVTGGLAGDNGRFRRTVVHDGDRVDERSVMAIGFYGTRLRVGHGSVGGWESFGPIRRVTRSEHNVLYELDGKPALEIYETYLGEDAEQLPASGLLFPLAMVSPDLRETGLIRTLLAVDRQRGSLTFAGNLARGSLVRLMHANFDSLVDGSEAAADLALGSLQGAIPPVSLLISCVGRRLLMGSNTDQELEAARQVLGGETCITGFYSNGEISPFLPTARCELHNQTMTITTLHEAS